MKPSEIIREAKCLLFERGWGHGASESDDGRLCIIGAINAAEGFAPDRTHAHIPNRDVNAAIVAAIDYPHAFGWNDRYCRTFSEVIDALDRAEKIAEAREALDA